MPDTYISQFSGEEIDSALRAAQIISGASTPAELRKKLEIRGDTIPVSATDPTPISEALTTSGGGVNPNLLDNWFFGRPVNQRGQTEWASSASAYVPCVDRWNWWGQYVAGSTLKLLDDGLQLIGEPNVAGLYQYISQKIEKDRLLIGAAVTLSVLVKSESDASIILSIDGENYTIVAVQANVWELITYTFNAPSVEQTYNISIQRNTAGTTFTVKAAKLELGDTQTLAHKENGAWVLNEIPDFGEQLRRCQRHAFSPLYEAYATAIICNLFVSSVANGVAFGEVTLPVSMRNKPVFSGNASKFWIVAENGGGASHPTAISVMGLSADKVMIQVNGSYTANTQYILYVEDPFTSADFLLSADL